MEASHERYGTMNILGNYADLARSLGGWSERVDDPGQIVGALQRARRVTDDGKATLLEFVTSGKSLTRECGIDRLVVAALEELSAT